MQSFIKEFPDYSKFFSFPEFNEVQRKCYQPLTRDTRNMVVSSPTSSGKTVIFQLAIIDQLKHGLLKCLYLAPIKSLCHEKFSSWHQKFRKLTIFELTSDTSAEQESSNQLDSVNLVIATPEKIDAYSRKSLDYLSKINLLLIDEVHMLNFEERGATLEAVISRIMSISNPRVIAVSATIPNIKEVAQWLKVAPEMTFVFGEEYRPVKINKIVLGFKSSNNPYTFEKLLNYKLTEVIRNYSQERGVLVFCQTQKGTQMACQQVISDMKERQFIDCDQTLLALIQGSKRVANTTLQIMLPQGIAFHNAGLSLQDRTIVERLFLDNKIRVLCTTSTLAMGINLPARLVVIKSTQCYRGAGKGYQQYTQIEMDQMIGRAGRPPFDTEGTVVIMTEKQNYNKYLNSGKLQTLQSHLYGQLTEHLNAEISLKSIKCFEDALKYFRNSFCYIRMKNSPHSYGIKTSIEVHAEKICLDSLHKLNNFNLAKFYPDNGNVVPRQLGVNIARNSIQIQTIVTIIKEISKVKTERDFFSLLCESQEIQKYRNKLDERKLLKQINQKNKYVLKNAVSNSQKKCYVLVQCELDGRHIENWQLRKQAKEMMFFFRRLTFCVKSACSEMKLFWPYFWSCMMNKYFTLKFWDRNEQMSIRQFQELNQKWKTLSAKGFKNINHVMNNLQNLDTICQKNSQFSQGIKRKIENLRSSVIIKISKTSNANSVEENEVSEQAYEQKVERRNTYTTQKDTLVDIKFCGEFDANFGSILIVVGQAYELYTIRILKQECKQVTIALNSNKSYHVAVIKSNFIGFDEFYQITNGSDIKVIQNIGAFIDVESHDKFNKANKQKNKEKHNEISKDLVRSGSEQENQASSHSCGNFNDRQTAKNSKQIKPDQNEVNKKRRSAIVNGVNSGKGKSLAQNSKMQAKKREKVVLISRKKVCGDYHAESDQEQVRASMKPGSYIPLNEYKCWKPGFRTFEEGPIEEEQPTAHKLMIIDEKSSQSKQRSVLDKLATAKSKSSIHWDKYAYTNKVQPPARYSGEPKQKPPAPNMSSNPYEYFLNLFTQ